MKIYTQTYDLSTASPQRFWVTPFSDFKIGIKLLSKGELLDKDFTVKAGEVVLTPDEDKIDGFTIFTIKSGNTGSVDYTIEVEGVAEKLKLTQIVTDSTVFDIDASGGDIPADVATQTWVNSQISGFITDDALVGYATENWVESQISGFVEEDALTAYATKDDLTAYAETADLTAYAEKTDLTDYVPLSGNANMTGSLSVTNDFSGVKLQSNDGITIWDVDEGNTKYANFDYDGLYVKNYNESTAKEITYPTKGGTMLVDTDLTAYYTKSETSSAIEISNGLIGKVTGGAETGTTGTPAAIQAIKSVYETDWATLSATAISSTFYVIVADPA